MPTTASPRPARAGIAGAGTATRSPRSRRWLRRLVPHGHPDDLLGAVQRLFVLLGVVFLVLAAVELAGRDLQPPMLVAGWIGLGAVAAWMVAIALRARVRLPLLDALLLGALAASVVAAPRVSAGLLLLALLQRPLHGTRRSALIVAVGIAAIRDLGLWLNEGPAALAEADAFAARLGIIGLAWLLTLLADVLAAHDRGRELGEILARAGAGLARARTATEVWDVALAGLAALAGDHSEARVSVWRARRGELELVAGHAPATEGAERVPIPRLPGEVARLVRSGEPYVLDRDGMQAATAAIGVRPLAPEAIVAPFPSGARAGGALLIALDTVTESLAEATARLALGVGLALERVAADELVRAVFDSSTDAVLSVDRTVRIRLASPAIRELCGRAPDELVGVLLEELIDVADAPQVRAALSEVLDGGQRSRLVDCRVRHRDGSSRSAELTVSELRHGGEAEGAVVNLRDVSERDALEAEVAFRALHDPLTGLPNRALFRDRVDAALQRAQQAGSGLATVVIDLDDFKTVNEGLGHAVGDALLGHIADRLTALRGGSHRLARIGGDEFALLVEDVAAPEGALATVNDLRAELEQPLSVHGHEVSLRFSAGVAHAPVGRAEPEMLLRESDRALETAKQRGKNRVEIFEASMAEPALETLALRVELNRGVARREFSAVYQPIVDLVTGAPVGAEALLRWNHPSRGQLGPTEFLTVAEKDGLLETLGRETLVAACAEAGRWSQVAERTLSVSVNLSARQLAAPSLGEIVSMAMAEGRLQPGQLVLEVTEGSLLEDLDEAARTLAELRSRGARVAIDDFGTGYSSLAYLKHFPVDVLKIDKAFVDGVGRGPEVGALAQAVVTLASRLGLVACAEGITASAQHEQLRSWGCELGQGHLFSAALPAEQMRETLTAAPLPEFT